MLYVYNTDFERLGMVGKFSYLLWRKRYSKHGEAELRVDATTRNIKLLQKGNILYRSDDNEAMYIYYRGFDDDGKSDQLVVKCFSLIRWLDRRVLWGVYRYNDTPENIVRSMITSELINPDDPDRVISQIKLAPAKGFGETIEKQSSYSSLLNQVESLCNTHEIGIRSLFDGRDFLIDLYQGIDRTVNQKENTRIILSKEFANVLSRDYEEADNDYKNTALIAGAGEGAERKITSIEQGSGLNRREVYIDARDIQDIDRSGNTIPKDEYMELLNERGNEKLKDYVESLSFECELDVTKENTKYGRDFFLGDIITIRDDKLGIVMNSRVVEVDEVFKDADKEVYVTAGESVPTLIDKVRKMVRQ